MEKLVQQALQEAAALKKQPGTVPWKLDEPWPQAYHAWNAEQGEWEAFGLPTPHGDEKKSWRDIATLALYSWNIDLMLPSAKARMDAALAHLQKLTEPLLASANTAVVIYLQECVRSDLDTISQTPWVRDRFYITDVDDSAWASGAYGTTTLVDRRLKISSCFRLHYSKTYMERDALFVDVAIPAPSGADKTVRLCNTHLESLTPEPPLRPSQMKLAAEYMHADGVSGAIIAGDFNAIQPPDQSLHTDNGLKDAYLELGGKPDSEEGHTWGQQALPVLRHRFGCSRMDKVFFCGGGLKLLSFERFGADVVLDETLEEHRNELLALGFEKPWITDHLGVSAVFSLPGASGHHL